MAKKHQADSNPVTLAIDEWPAHDAAFNGNTNPIPGAAYAFAPADTAVTNQVSANADAVRLIADRDGAIYSHPYPPRIWNTMNSFTATQSAAVVKAGTAGLSIYVRTIGVSIPTQTAAVTRMSLINSSTTTVWAREFPATGNVNLTDTIDPPIKLTAANSLRVTTAGTSASCDLFVSGFMAP
jgi:hypothetical protein